MGSLVHTSYLLYFPFISRSLPSAWFGTFLFAGVEQNHRKKKRINGHICMQLLVYVKSHCRYGGVFDESMSSMATISVCLTPDVRWFVLQNSY